MQQAGNRREQSLLGVVLVTFAINALQDGCSHLAHETNGKRLVKIERNILLYVLRTSSTKNWSSSEPFFMRENGCSLEKRSSRRR